MIPEQQQNIVRLSDEFCWDDEDHSLLIYIPAEDYELEELYSSSYTYGARSKLDKQ